MPKPSLKSRELSSGEALKRLLPAFPVGIGERHDHLNGRALVLECLEPFRMVSYDEDRNAAVVRFRTAEMAERARSQMR